MAKNVDFLENSHTVTTHLSSSSLGCSAEVLRTKVGKKHAKQHLGPVGLGPQLMHAVALPPP